MERDDSSVSEASDDKWRSKSTNIKALKLPHLKYENKSLFDGVEKYINTVYEESSRQKPVNFCSQKYKSYIRTQQKQNKEGYSQLSQQIKASNETVKKVKRGLPLTEQKEYRTTQDSKSIPFFDRAGLRQDLKTYIDSTVEECYQDQAILQSRNSLLPSTNQNSSLGTLQTNPYSSNPALEKKKTNVQCFNSINPAFFHSSVSKSPMRLKSLRSYYQSKNLSMTKEASLNKGVQKVQKEHQIFCDKLSQVLSCYSELDLEQKICDFVSEMNLDDLSEAEKELIFSRQIGINLVGRSMKRNVETFLRKINQRKQAFQEEAGEFHATQQSQGNAFKASFHNLNKTIQKGSPLKISQANFIPRQLPLQSSNKISHMIQKSVTIKTNTTAKTRDDEDKRRIAMENDGLSQMEEREVRTYEKQFKEEEGEEGEAAVLWDVDEEEEEAEGENKQRKMMSKHFKRFILGQKKREALVGEHDQCIKQIKEGLSEITLCLDKKHGAKALKKKNNFSYNQEDFFETQAQGQSEKALRKLGLMKELFNQRNRPLARMLSTTERIQKNRKQVNKNLLQMLDRIDLDRPLLIKEKMKTFWQEENEQSQRQSPRKDLDSSSRHNTSQFLSTARNNSHDIRGQLDEKKLQRKRVNVAQKEVYNQLMFQMAKRRLDKIETDTKPEEIRFFNLAKIILDGGWTIDRPVYEDMLNFCGISSTNFPNFIGRAFLNDSP